MFAVMLLQPENLNCGNDRIRAGHIPENMCAIARLSAAEDDPFGRVSACGKGPFVTASLTLTENLRTDYCRESTYSGASFMGAWLAPEVLITSVAFRAFLFFSFRDCPVFLYCSLRVSRFARSTYTFTPQSCSIKKPCWQGYELEQVLTLLTNPQLSPYYSPLYLKDEFKRIYSWLYGRVQFPQAQSFSPLGSTGSLPPDHNRSCCGRCL